MKFCDHCATEIPAGWTRWRDVMRHACHRCHTGLRLSEKLMQNGERTPDELNNDRRSVC